LWCPTYPPLPTRLLLKKTRKRRRKNGKGRKKKVTKYILTSITNCGNLE
jgi:hypothetical protein